jgi:hypothetical protein
MVKMSIYDWSCAELIHSYVEIHFDDFARANIEDDISELQFAVNNHEDFREWASVYGYEISMK